MKKWLERVKNLNFKSIARAASIVWMFVFIVVMTITSVQIDEKFNFIKWLGRAMILFGITVYGMFVAESMAKDYGKKRVVKNTEGKIIGGEYQVKLTTYNEYRKEIDPILIHFPAFYDWFVPQRIENKKYNFLLMCGMNPTKAHNIVKYATMDDFFPLQAGAVKFTDPQTHHDIFVKKLLTDEVEPVKAVLGNKVKYELSALPYYLQATEESHDYDIMEMGSYYKKARKTNKWTSYAMRLGTGLGVSIALSVLTVGDFVSGNDTQAWMNLVTRMANLFTSMFSGWVAGASDVHLEAKEIESKVDVLKMFKSSYDLHLFPILSEDEMAKQQWEQQEKEKEEAEKNVVEPEIVTDKALGEEKPHEDESIAIDIKPLQIENKETEKE